MLKYMLDTNICIYVIKRRPLDALVKFNENAGSICISSITMAELMHGAEKSEQRARNLSIVEDFISRLDVLSYGEKAAMHYGDIRADLEKKGTIIGANDLHIAAHARSEALVLVSNNLKEFERVDGLRSCNWV